MISFSATPNYRFHPEQRCRFRAAPLVRYYVEKFSKKFSVWINLAHFLSYPIDRMTFVKPAKRCLVKNDEDTVAQLAVAHVRKGPADDAPVWHSMEDHQRCVAHIASTRASVFASAQWAWLAGIWHDLGKYRPGFQRYIRQAMDTDAHIEGRVAGREKTHSAAGALHALRVFEERFGPHGAIAGRILAYVIAGHHAGLADWTGGLDKRLLGTHREDSEREYTEALAACQATDPAILELPPEFDLRAALEAIPGLRSTHPDAPRIAVSLWVRMLFSALVDADFLDTERFMDGGKADGRCGALPLADFLGRLDIHLTGQAADVLRAGRTDHPVMRARSEVLHLCRSKAALAPGVFSLTVPTGGGKTLSSLAFALEHAVAHDKRRVIYAIPYTSIIEQTADVFRAIFGVAHVVEHHSQAETTDTRETLRSRLACENWDAPLVVTTNVQLFESLFASRTSRCRKLHNIANSVIVLDEAQLLPPEFLQPILDALHVLVLHYGVTVLLCTATQPALTTRTEFDPRKNLRGLPRPTEIIEDAAALFSALQRVKVRWPDNLNVAVELSTLVPELVAHDCVLVIVNTRADSRALTQLLPEGTLHLSAAMCGAHRKDVIDTIRQRLQARRNGDTTPLRVVSTQLVEAGVDIDFPVVYRALAGLDSIAQAAGRCNREGLLEYGQVVVFVRDIPRTLSQLQRGVEATRSVHQLGLTKALTPATFKHYFQVFYGSLKSLDAKDIVADLANEAHVLKFDFRCASDKFKLVDDKEQATLIVPYHLFKTDHSALEKRIVQLENGDVNRWLMREVQRYTVNVRKRQIDMLVGTRDCREVSPGLYVLQTQGVYDHRFGLMPKGQPLDPESLVH